MANLWLYGPEYPGRKDKDESHLVTAKHRGSDSKQTQFVICGESVMLTDEQVAELICYLLDLPYDKN